MASQKITPKNLSYTTTLPPFLQRLHNSASNSGLDGRHEFAIARPKRARDPNADEEDEPAYVDEETNHTLSKEEYKALIFGAGEDAGQQEGKAVPETENKEQGISKNKDNAIIGGATRKRKAVKIISTEAGSESDADIGPKNSNSHITKRQVAGVKKDGQDKVTPKTKNKAKAKKVKLSFGDDDEG